MPATESGVRGHSVAPDVKIDRAEQSAIDRGLGLFDRPHYWPCTWPGHSGRWRYRRNGYTHPQSFALAGLNLRHGERFHGS